MSAVSLCCSSPWLTKRCRVVPRLEAMKLSTSSCQALVDELHSQQSKFRFPEGYSGRTLTAVILAFAQKYLAAFVPQQAAGILAVLEPRLFFPDRKELLELLK